MKKAVSIILAALLAAALAACTDSGVQEQSSASADKAESSQQSSQGAESEPAVLTERFSDFDLDDSTPDNATVITLADENITISGSGASSVGSVLTITAAGTYVLSGKLSDGQITVTAPKTDKVHLILKGVNVTCRTSGALIIDTADKVCITLANGTDNTFSDAYTYTTDTTSGPTACIYGKEDLTINGSGTLTVNGNYKNGIATKNDLKLVSGSINVTAKNNAVKGKGSVSIKGGTISIQSNDDGIKSDEENNPLKGYIYIEGGTIMITANDDALQAVTDITITGGTVTAKAGGKADNCDGTKNIAEGCLIKK